MTERIRHLDPSKPYGIVRRKSGEKHFHPGTAHIQKIEINGNGKVKVRRRYESHTGHPFDRMTDLLSTAQKGLDYRPADEYVQEMTLSQHKFIVSENNRSHN